ncbi:MAG: hypothetical protein LUG95_05180 [Clostridiales bacterium]|nr:hypothetical protein [Clostridiales bacterium]
MKKFAYIEKGLSGKVKKELQKEFTPKAVEIKKILFTVEEKPCCPLYMKLQIQKQTNCFQTFRFLKGR